MQSWSESAPPPPPTPGPGQQGAGGGGVEGCGSTEFPARQGGTASSVQGEASYSSNEGGGMLCSLERLCLQDLAGLPRAWKPGEATPG